MSVETTVDKKLNEAKEFVSNACRSLVEVLDKDTWGFENLSEEQINNNIEQSLIELLKIKRKL